MASGVPMDILLPDGQSRVPTMSRNAGGRRVQLRGRTERFSAAGQCGWRRRRGAVAARLRRRALYRYLQLPGPARVSPVRGRDGCASRPSREVFNLFNVTNILGTSNRNYSGYVNALVRDSNDPADPGYLRSSRFGTPASTAGGVFGSGGPRALQFGARVSF